MFIEYIEIPKNATRYLDMPEEKKRELLRKKRRRRRWKKPESEDEDKEEAENKTPNRQNLHSTTQEIKRNSKKDPIEITFNDGESLKNWDYEVNNYKN
ncbi:hypothetical protein [Bacillus nitratireducens]|uniref:hypothetical protein n=1 Tax=Bacillus nitratireducens TaxID=2026193 RepID=UPI003D3023EF